MWSYTFNSKFVHHMFLTRLVADIIREIRVPFAAIPIWLFTTRCVVLFAFFSLLLLLLLVMLKLFSLETAIVQNIELLNHFVNPNTGRLYPIYKSCECVARLLSITSHHVITTSKIIILFYFTLLSTKACVKSSSKIFK